MKRYDPIVPHGNGPGAGLDESVMRERPDGEWVRWEDIEELLKLVTTDHESKEAFIQRVREVLQ